MCLCNTVHNLTVTHVSCIQKQGTRHSTCFSSVDELGGHCISSRIFDSLSALREETSYRLRSKVSLFKLDSNGSVMSSGGILYTR
jgi:hypothetical protein